jgi:hypothetical protein
MVLFMGEIKNGQLPMFMLEPVTGLPNSFLSQPTAVPNDAFVENFYSTHTHQEWIPSRTAALNMENHNMSYLAFLPMPFVPAFIGGLSPREALVRTKEIMMLLPVADQAKFNYLLEYLQAACHKSAGANAGSKMLLPLANPGRDPNLVQWCVQQMAS